MDRCPHCGVALPAFRDAFCPECRNELDRPPDEPLADRANSATADLGPAPEPLSKYPVARLCPGCQSAAYKRVRPDRWIAFAWDRVCKSCGVRYTPPTPLWAGAVFIASGLPLVAFGVFGIVTGLAAGNPLPLACEGVLGLLGAAAIVHGIRSLLHRGRV
jgi:hypothetical protein